MNCKPGDLAIIVQADGAHNLGRLVLCISLHKATFLRPHGRESLLCWKIEPPLENHAKNGITDFAPDAWLRPIRDPGEDAKDETLHWLPVPSREEMPA